MDIGISQNEHSSVRQAGSGELAAFACAWLPIAPTRRQHHAILSGRWGLEDEIERGEGLVLLILASVFRDKGFMVGGVGAV